MDNINYYYNVKLFGIGVHPLCGCRWR